METISKFSPQIFETYYRIKSSFDSNVISRSALLSIAEALHKYELFDNFENRHNSSTVVSN